MTGPLSRRPLSRRRFLAAGGAGAAGAALVAGACSGGGDGDGGGGPAPPPTTRAPVTGDLAVAELAARLEKLAVDAYRATLTALDGRSLGDVPPALAEVFATAGAHHDVYLSSWNTFLRRGGRPDVTEPHTGLKPMIDTLFGRVTDAAGAARVAIIVEDVAAQTYNRAIPTLRGRDAVRLAAQIQVVEQQHISVLRFLLGLYPVGSGEVAESKAFQPTDRAAS